MDNFKLVGDKLLKCLDFDFFDKAIISNPFKKGEGICFKVVVSKSKIKGNLAF